MFSICQTSHPPTTVEHSTECKFYSPNENNLVVAGANQLTVYKIVCNQNKPNHSIDHQVDESTDLETDKYNQTNHKTREPAQDYRLEFMQSFELYGTIASMQKVALGDKHSYKRDSLVLSFLDAKLSVVEYDPETHDLKTVSLHYFEDESLRNGSVTDHMNPPLVRVDPENRCIAMLIYGRHVVIVTLDKDEEKDLEDELYNSSGSASTSSIFSSSSDDENADQEPMSVQHDGDKNQKLTAAGQNNNWKPSETTSSRAPVLLSYKIDLTEEACGEKIDTIVDIQFLHNYNDPTLVILHEPIRTWSGRVAMRQDTCSMVALSMNVHQRLHPVIWTVNNLPYESLRIMPVPKPIGGLLVLACNELIYLNQSVPPFGMSFNSFTKDSSSFPLNNLGGTGESVEYINVSLDLSQAVFLNHNKILFILKDGDVCLVTLFNDDMRTIKNFHFERFASTVQPHCLTLCENDLLFIGSHVGDSVLVEILGDYKSTRAESPDFDKSDSPVNGQFTKEELYLHEHDRILSLSASGQICYGQASNISESLSHSYRDPFVELLTTAGQHKNGSICVFQRSIKPLIEDTYELRDCGTLFALWPSHASKPLNHRLLLNRENETMVFSTNGELLELKRDECAFDTSAPTVFATNIGHEDLTLQVMTNGALLISDDKVIDQVRFEEPVNDACIVDSEVIALTSSNSIYHMRVVSPSEDGGLSESVDRYALICRTLGQISKGRIISISLYKDVSGMFTCKRDKYTVISPTYWLFTADEQGVLEVFSVPDFEQVYSVDNLSSGPNVLCDNVKLFIVDVDPMLPKTKEIMMCALGRDGSRPVLLVRSELELLVYEAFSFLNFDIPNHLKLRFKKLTALLLKTLEPPTQYEPLPQKMHDQSNSLALMDVTSEPSNEILPAAVTDTRTGSSREKTSRSRLSARERCLRDGHWLRKFERMGGYEGVFLMGFRPHWIIMADRGALRVHPMNAEGAVYSFSPYINDNFIYYTDNRELKIARLPKHLDLDAHWPLKKVPIKETVHFVNYHVERKIYCVVTSLPSPCYKIMRVGSEPDSMKTEELDREGGYIPPTTEKFKLTLYDPVNWEQVPDCEMEFEEWEQVTCVKNVLLASEGTSSGLKGYIAISTNYCYGEDVPNRGRICILDLIEVVPEPDRPLTKNKIKKVYCQEQKGPVTTLSHTCGLLMSAVGQKIYLWQLKEEQLDGVAFIDTQIYIHCASSVKNLILVSDVCKSVSLLRYQQGTRTLSMVCRDFRPLEVFACDFAVDNELLNFVVMDSEKNIIIYAYDPEHEESYGGTRLLRRADFHLGAHVTSLCRLRGKVPSFYADKKDEAALYRRRHITMFCTVDGAIGMLYPISESTHQRLHMLENEMTLALPHAAGLNPKAWRIVKQARPSVPFPCKLIVDGDIIRRFLNLSHRERLDLTKKIGTSPDRILADIQLVQESTMCF